MRLNEADFILTLMSVFREDLRAKLDGFSRSSKSLDKSKPGPFNHFIEPASDQMLRVAAGVAFSRGRLRHVYTMLRGKDMDTGETSPEIRERQFEQLSGAIDQTLELVSWQSFHKTLMSAGFSSNKTISSKNALLYTYILFLIGKNRYGVDHAVLRRAIARWFFMASLTMRYTNSPESAIEEDLVRLRDVTDGAGFLADLEEQTSAVLTGDFWSVTLPSNLATSSGGSPSLYAFYASLQLQKADVLFSHLSVSSLLDPTVKEKKAPVDRHHLFPRSYLKKSGITKTAEQNQIANFALVEWQDNIDISDDPPASYVPDYERRLVDAKGEAALELQYEQHALWPGWWDMPYDKFLGERRSRMADSIRRGFDLI